jgi:hypothetical protein
MPERSDPKRFLRLIGDDFDSPVESHAFQFGLFPSIDPAVVSFCHSTFLESNPIIDFAKRINPRCVFDVRAVPSFRSLNLSRKQAFDFFDEIKAEYVDVSGMLDRGSISSNNVDLIGQFVCSYLSRMDISRPVVLIFDSFNVLDAMAGLLPSCMSERFKRNFTARVFVGGRSGINDLIISPEGRK